MAASPSHRHVHRHIAERTDRPVLDVLGPTIEFLTSPDEADGGLCVMRGVIPPGVVVPIHSHDDAEAFYILAGTQQDSLKAPTASSGTTPAPATTSTSLPGRHTPTECLCRSRRRLAHHDGAPGTILSRGRQARHGPSAAAKR